MVRWLHDFSNWKFILPLFILFAFFSFYLFPEYQSQMGAHASQQVQPLDTRVSYTTEEVKTLFTALGVEGRNLYSFITGKIDMVYPVIYGLMLTLILAYLIRKLSARYSPLLLFALLPLAGMVFDYLENIQILRLLDTYPEFSDQMVATGQTLTRTKHGFLFLSITLILLLAIVYATKRFLLKKNSRT
jgi:hypothetical protein